MAQNIESVVEFAVLERFRYLKVRKKIAMRWRREALRRGAILSDEKMAFSKKELRENNLKRKHNGFSFCAEYNGWKWLICANDMLAAYKMFIQEIDCEHDWME